DVLPPDLLELWQREPVRPPQRRLQCALLFPALEEQREPARPAVLREVLDRARGKEVRDARIRLGGRPVERERVERRRAVQQERDPELPARLPVQLAGGPARVALVEPARDPRRREIAVQRDVRQLVAQRAREVLRSRAA